MVVLSARTQAPHPLPATLSTLSSSAVPRMSKMGQTYWANLIILLGCQFTGRGVGVGVGVRTSTSEPTSTRLAHKKREAWRRAACKLELHSRPAFRSPQPFRHKRERHRSLEDPAAGGLLAPFPGPQLAQVLRQRRDLVCGHDHAVERDPRREFVVGRRHGSILDLQGCSLRACAAQRIEAKEGDVRAADKGKQVKRLRYTVYGFSPSRTTVLGRKQYYRAQYR